MKPASFFNPTCNLSCHSIVCPTNVIKYKSDMNLRFNNKKCYSSHFYNIIIGVISSTRLQINNREKNTEKDKTTKVESNWCTFF